MQKRNCFFFLGASSSQNTFLAQTDKNAGQLQEDFLGLLL